MSFDLQKIEGAECPQCGCENTELRGGRFECNFCGKGFTAITPARVAAQVVHYVVKRIPICPVHNKPMHDEGRSKSGGVIYYKCPVCECRGSGARRIV